MAKKSQPKKSNVIVFPKENPRVAKNKTITPEEVNENIKMMNMYHVQESIANIIPSLFTQLETAGFPLAEDASDIKGYKAGALIVESVRSLMFAHYEIPHPFQKLSNAVFEPVEDVADGLKIVDRIRVTLQDKKAKLENDNS